MNKEQVYAFLNEKGIAHTVVEHPPVFTVEDLEALDLPNPEAGAKNLFLHDDKKQNFYLFTVRDHLPVRIKNVQKHIGARPLSFATEEELMTHLGLTRGAVSPFGILNDTECSVRVFIDEDFRGRTISVHPNENTATVYLACDDLLSLIRQHGNAAQYLNFEELIP